MSNGIPGLQHGLTSAAPSIKPPGLPIGSLPFAFAAAGGVLGALSASAKNKSIQKQAKIGQERINKFKSRVLFQSMMATEDQSQAAQRAVGAALNMAPDGASVMETIAERLVVGTAGDDFAIREDARNRVEAAEFERQNLVTQANNQMTNPLLEILGASMQGAMMGIGLKGQFEGLAAAETAAGLTEQIQTQELAAAALGKERAETQLDIARLQRSHIAKQLGQASVNLQGIGQSIANLGHVFGRFGLPAAYANVLQRFKAGQ